MTMKQKAVVLDGEVLYTDHISWKGVEALVDELVCYDTTPPDQVIERSKDASILFLSKVQMTREIMEQLPNLKYIGELATGYNNIDVQAAKELGITVTNVPAYSTDSVAQHVFALLLEMTNHVGELTQSVQSGDWVKSPSFTYWISPIVELRGKTLGLVGYGNIGRQVAVVANAFGMKIKVWNHRPIRPSQVPVQQVEWDELLEQSDVISIHVPLTEGTENLFNAETLQKMKPSAILINTARGPIVNSMDLAKALTDGVIAAAGIDVLEKEPMEPNHPLLGLKNVYITPHVSWTSFEARQRLVNHIAENLEAFQQGNPLNQVN